MAKRSGRRYEPDRGDVVWVDLDPQMGREQSGRRPCLVLSPRKYNAKVGLALCCPITRQAKGYPFEVPAPPDLPVRGAVLCDHLKSLDWRARRAKLLCKLPNSVVGEIWVKLQALLGSGGPHERPVQ